MHGLVQKIVETCERVANIILNPGANYTHMYNLHTVSKSAHVNGALIDRQQHDCYEWSFIDKFSSTFSQNIHREFKCTSE